MVSLTPPSSPLILSLESEQNTLQSAGGKAANLARLIQARFRVPSGFVITTSAYQLFSSKFHLEEQIQEILGSSSSKDTQKLDLVSSKIRDLFSKVKVPNEISSEIRSAYQRLGEVPVAIRSSATLEDLPGLSFAGQQDTYLNICSLDEVLKAVVNCWSSLWTARALDYRNHNRLSNSNLSLAVVVQEMVESESSGVLFTANPLTGLRSEVVIDATFGLGEALVSGMVNPDHYVVDVSNNQISSKVLGAKSVEIIGYTKGGTRQKKLERAMDQALPDEEILALAKMSKEVEGLYGFPQDIEWAWAKNQLFILQSRPITTLYPLPVGLPDKSLKVFFSFAAVQGMLDPVTPLGREALCLFFATGAGLFGIKTSPSKQTILYSAGERLWVNFTPLIRNSVGRQVIPFALNLVEPTIQQAVNQITDDPRLQPGKKGVSLHARLQIAHLLIPLAGNVLLNLLSPKARREAIVLHGEHLLEKMESQSANISGDRWEKLAQRAVLLPDFANKHLPKTLIRFVSVVATAMASWNFLNRLASKTSQNLKGNVGTPFQDLVMQVTRGMPYNPTTEMDLNLWKMAKMIRHDPPSLQVFLNNNPSQLTEKFQRGELPQIVIQPLSEFFQRYGGRGFGEIDLGRNRWAEDSTHVFEMLSSFLQIEDETLAPDIVFAKSAKSAQSAINQLVDNLRKTKHGWWKAIMMKFLAGRVRQLIGMRESPKFFAVRLMWIIHRDLVKSGHEFVEHGELDQPDDLFYLSFAEIQSFANQEKKNWSELISNRRSAYQIETLRRQIPKLMLSDGRAYYEGLKSQDNLLDTLHGSPVSPGVAEGKVRIVLNPIHAHLKPGEILVCPGTDPSWTPLFLSASGLVMETGGMMTHGAVVAREYGIPAIVGVDQATHKLKTGMLIRIDGSQGTIVILKQDPD
jgi:rifampicin phosphotransferase